MKTTLDSKLLKRLKRTALSCQGLAKVRPFGVGVSAVGRALEHLGYIQIDTISVVERAHHHTLWTRIPSYRSDSLSKLVREKRAFEYWSHAASYLPMRDYRFALPRMSAAKRGDSVYATADAKTMRQVLARIRDDGPLKARNFENPKRNKGTWWDWKPAKRALEQLFMEGELMIIDRDGMEKIYDLRERALPTNVDTSEPTTREYADYLIETALTAHGFASIKQLAHLRSGKALRAALADSLQERVASESVIEIVQDGLPSLYADHARMTQSLPAAPNKVRLLSPFDNATIHRERLQLLFGFDYRLECYVPAKKREFGYFCLPVLYADEIVGRIDCKAHRRKKELDIVHLHLERRQIDIGRFVEQFVAEIYRFAAFNGCDSVILSNSSPRKLAKLVTKELRMRH